MAKIAVIYHSVNGHTKAVAECMAEGIRNIAGTNVHLLEIKGEDVVGGRWRNEEIIDMLRDADALAFGCPTHMGGVSAVFTAFMEWGFYPWLNQEWKNRLAAGFTNSSSQSGDKLNTLTSLQVFASQMAMIWVPMGDFPGNNWSGGTRHDINRLGSFMGLMTQSNTDQDALEALTEADRITAVRFGEHFAKVVRRWLGEEIYKPEKYSAAEWRAWDTDRVNRKITGQI